MKNTLLVAAREFRQIASMRSFWLTLVIMPLSIVIGAIAPQFIEKDEPDRVMVIDRAGGAKPAQSRSVSGSTTIATRSAICPVTSRDIISSVPIGARPGHSTTAGTAMPT
jgi:ABC-type Na+ efflux pump permease subunit